MDGSSDTRHRLRAPGSIAVLGLALLLAVRLHRAAQREAGPRSHDHAQGPLRYRVPTGQDPAPLFARLRRSGYTVTMDSSGTHHDVVIDSGTVVARREQVRALLEGSPLDMAGAGALDSPVRFVDEPGRTAPPTQAGEDAAT